MQLAREYRQLCMNGHEHSVSLRKDIEITEERAEEMERYLRRLTKRCNKTAPAVELLESK